MNKKSIKRTSLALFITLCAVSSIFLISCEQTENDIPADYFFKARGVTVRVGENVDNATSALGEYNSLYLAPSCAVSGVDQMYVYNGFRLTAYPEADKHIIYIIELTNDTVSTAEGVSVGDTREKVISVYGETYESVGESVRYKGRDCLLQFIIREGKVTSIKYLAQTD